MSILLMALCAAVAGVSLALLQDPIESSINER